MKAATMNHEGAVVTTCSIPAGEVSYSTIFCVNNDGTVSIVSGVMLVSTLDCLASNATTYAGDKVYVS